jgi:hypothetical protein
VEVIGRERHVDGAQILLEAMQLRGAGIGPIQCFCASSHASPICGRCRVLLFGDPLQQVADRQIRRACLWREPWHP